MRASIQIQNLKCGGCANSITKSLSANTAISNIEVNLDESVVCFDYTNETDLEAVKSTLKQLGYPSVEDSNSLGAKAKSFVSCATGKFSS